ncbi:MAG: hypothetical protein PUF51_07315 [Bifidobacteriaceae bacterium]|nr:hypothetical protein [Bifidobacteriaceae bacterium]
MYVAETPGRQNGWESEHRDGVENEARGSRVFSNIEKPARADSKKYDSKVANIRRSLRAYEGECVFDMQLLQEAL